MRGAERERGVDRSLHVTAAGVGLHAGRAERVPVAGKNRREERRRIRALRVCGEKAEPSLEDRRRRAEARRGEGGSVEPRAGRPAGVQALRPGPVGEELHRTRRLAAGDPERCRERIHVEPEHGAGCGRRPEGTARSRRMKPATIVRRRSERPREPRRDLVASDRRAEHELASGLGELGRGEGRREHAGAEVDRALLVGVVHLERVGSCAVGERRLGRGQTVRGSEHGRGARERERTERATQDDARLDVRPAERDAEVVAEEDVCPLDDGWGEGPVADRRRVGGKPPCERLARLGHAHRCPSLALTYLPLASWPSRIKPRAPPRRGAARRRPGTWSARRGGRDATPGAARRPSARLPSRGPPGIRRRAPRPR